MKEWIRRFIQNKFYESVSKYYNVQQPRDGLRFDTKNQSWTYSPKNNYIVAFTFPFCEEFIRFAGLPNFAFKTDGACTNPACYPIREIINVTWGDIESIWDSIPVSDKKVLLSIVPEGVMQSKVDEILQQEAALVQNKTEAIKSCEIVQKLTKENTKAEFLHLLYMMDYEPEDNDYVWNLYKTDFTDFPGRPIFVKDSRAFYCLDDERYFVVSKNPYDFFFASQGNGFESCFSLTSSYFNVHGVPFWVSHKNFFMTYITNGTVTKWSAWNGKKAKIPHMESRFWGYQTKVCFVLGLRYGKGYGKTSSYIRDNVLGLSIGDTDNVYPMDTDYTLDEARKYRMYFDNFNPETQNFAYVRKQCNAECSAKGKYDSFKDLMSFITFDENIEYWNKAIIVGEHFKEAKILPKCGLIENFYTKIIEQNLTEKTRVEYFVCVDMGREVSNIESGYFGKKNPDIYFAFTYRDGKLYLKKGNEDERLVETV